LTNFWDDIIRRFGSREDVINIPGAPSITNKYIDHLENKVLAPHLSSFEGKSVLDIGTGVGRWASLLAEKASHVVGIDISREMVKITKKKVNGSNVDFLVATACAIPLRPDSVDVSLSCTCIQHIVDEDRQQESLHEITRVTRKKILLLELMSKSNLTKLTHYPTLVIPRVRYVSAFKTPEVKSIADIGVDFLPFVKLLENCRNSLFKKLGVKVPSFGGSVKQAALRNSYQIISVFALFFSLPFNKMVPNPSSNLTRHVLLVVQKEQNRSHQGVRRFEQAHCREALA
jgi:ubiquinone/menaquinone biosynthesis C-methylase UbiE